MTLKQITEELVSLEDSGDAENAHYRADDLLIEAINRLATGRTREMWDDSQRLIAAWREVPKWYA